MSKIIFFLLAIACTVSSSSTPVKKCKDVTEDLFKQVVVSTPKGICNKLPCDLISGADVKTDITFEVRKKTTVQNLRKLQEACNLGSSNMKVREKSSWAEPYRYYFNIACVQNVPVVTRKVPEVADLTCNGGFCLKRMTMLENEVEKITLKCNATTLGITIDYAIPNAQKGCDMLTNTFCPIESGTEADLTFFMNVSKIFPKIPVDLVMYLLDQNNKMISCFEVSAKVIDGK